MKNYKKFITFSILAVAVFGYTYFYSSLFNDEIWNYGFSYNIASGLIPYRDFNMIVTPLYHFIGAIFITIFGHHLWALHILNAIMISMMIYVMYHNINKKVWLLVPILLLYCYPNYNLFSLFLMIILISICDKDFRNHDIIMGLLCSFLFLTKQTIGISLTIPMLYYSKNKRKNLISFIIPILVFMIYLLWNKAMYDFINYCFLGMFDFTNQNKILFCLPLEITICCVLIYKLYKSKFLNKKLFFILMYQIITIPICDDYHFMIGFTLVLYYVLEIIEIKKYRVKYYIFIIFFITIYWNYTINNYGNLHLYNDKNSYLYGRYVDQYIEDNITSISTYMENTKENYNYIYLLTQNSYEIKMNTSLKINKFDLINNGNMGYQGSVHYLKEINNNCSNQKCMFILYKYEFEAGNISQTNKRIVNSIKDNYLLKEEYGDFDIYINQ